MVWYPCWHPWIIATSHCSTRASSAETPSVRSIIPYHFLIWIQRLPFSITLHRLCDFLFASCFSCTATRWCSFNISWKEFNLRLWHCIMWHTLKLWQCHTVQRWLIINGICVPNPYNQKQSETSYETQTMPSAGRLSLMSPLQLAGSNWGWMIIISCLDTDTKFNETWQYLATFYWCRQLWSQ